MIDRELRIGFFCLNEMKKRVMDDIIYGQNSHLIGITEFGEI